MGDTTREEMQKQRMDGFESKCRKNSYKIYPTYDFACPFVDAKEGITHALRSSEYHDRNAQYHRIQDDLGVRKVHLYEFSRLNMVNSLLSKHKLLCFVQNEKELQKNLNLMEWDKLWTINEKIIDPVCQRESQFRCDDPFTRLSKPVVLAIPDELQQAFLK
ncbi:glutamyl-tRNA synthetase [Citrus sinensis]|uniref:Glutamyl-tRNA synthetase n=1 Tax=Citrus sinensis TaxID=2711 RepID=A0ACB8IHB3_CITSI|nr:glutamyl-tRNA synthetase [Citrus sinensis]